MTSEPDQVLFQSSTLEGSSPFGLNTVDQFACQNKASSMLVNTAQLLLPCPSPCTNKSNKQQECVLLLCPNWDCDLFLLEKMLRKPKFEPGMFRKNKAQPWFVCNSKPKLDGLLLVSVEKQSFRAACTSTLFAQGKPLILAAIMRHCP